MSSLHAHLHARLGSAYRRLEESLSGLDAAEAAASAQADWRRYRFGTGLNGSIEGIVRHVAAWKHVAAGGLQLGTFPEPETVLPPGGAWEDLLALLHSGHQLLVCELEIRSDEQLDQCVTWEGHRMSVHALFAHLIEHDQYHAGQINLLRQQRGHDLE